MAAALSGNTVHSIDINPRMVEAGRQWGGDELKETKTGNDGRFRLLNLRSELQPVTATVEGYAPVSKAVTPGTHSTELTLPLNRGA